MPSSKFELHQRETLFQGFFRVDRLHFRHQRFDGNWSGMVTREVFSAGSYCAGVLPFDPHHDRVVLIEQFRPGPLARGDDPWTLELVAGIMDAGESSEVTVRREAAEEASCQITDLQPIASYYPSPGCVAQYFTLYAGRTNAPKDGIICGLAAEDEDIRVHVMDASQAISLLYAGKLRDATTIIAMQWFALHHTELRSRWLVSDASTPII